MKAKASKIKKPSPYFHHTLRKQSQITEENQYFGKNKKQKRKEDKDKSESE